jgi:hypothetical protein
MYSSYVEEMLLPKFRFKFWFGLYDLLTVTNDLESILNVSHKNFQIHCLLELYETKLIIEIVR